MANIKYPVIDGLKECGNCHLFLPISNYDKARYHYSSKCRECRADYAKKYRQLPEVKKHSAEWVKEYRSIQQNKDRLNAYNRNRNKRPDVMLLRNKQRREWTAREKQKAVDYKGGKCSVCKYNRCLAALEFHHLDPNTKEHKGKGAIIAHRTFEYNKPELDKCVLLCVRCHTEVHAGEITI